MLKPNAVKRKLREGPGAGSISSWKAPPTCPRSYGVPWQTRHPTVTAALRRIRAVCAEHGVPYCTIPRAREDYEAWREAGVTAFVLGEERGLAARALRGHLDKYRTRDEDRGRP